MFARAADRLLDLIWDATEPVAGVCLVCAFWRGALLGAFVATVATLLILAY